jgi:hypothetical protein
VKETAAQKGNQTSPALLCHIEALPRIVLLKVALIPQIERNTLLETKNSLSIDPRPSPGNRISSPTDLGHNPRAKMATATDHRVVIGSNVGSHLVTQRVQIMLATRVIELVPIRVKDRLATEKILEAMMTSPPETEVALYTTKTGMETSITSSSKEINLLI